MQTMLHSFQKVIANCSPCYHIFHSKQHLLLLPDNNLTRVHHSWQRDPNAPIFENLPLPFIAYPSFSKFCSSPPFPCRFQLPPPTLLLFLLLCFFGWMDNRATFGELFIYTYVELWYLVPEGSWCVFDAASRQVYWGLTHNVDFSWHSDLISHTCKHTQKDKQYTQGPVDWHTHINIYFHHLLCALSSYLYYIEYRMNNLLTSKI